MKMKKKEKKSGGRVREDVYKENWGGGVRGVRLGGGGGGGGRVDVNGEVKFLVGGSDQGVGWGRGVARIGVGG